MADSITTLIIKNEVSMIVGDMYSHKDGSDFILENHKPELDEIIAGIHSINATSVLTKTSEEKSKQPLLFSPVALNDILKNHLSPLGWTTPTTKGKKGFIEPKLYWDSVENTFHDEIGEKLKSEKEFREMDGIKNKVGLEIQFGKYAFMGYDIFSKMPIFAKRGLIDCGVELVAMQSLMKNMSTGVSSFHQIVMDMKARGVADIDIPTLIIGIECTPEECIEVKAKRDKFVISREQMIADGLVSGGRKGAKPGPK